VILAAVTIKQKNCHGEFFLHEESMPCLRTTASRAAPHRQRRRRRSRSIEARVERKALLQYGLIGASRCNRIEYDIPTMDRHYARHEQEFMRAQQRVSEALLSRGRLAGSQPIGVGNVCRPNDMDLAQIKDGEAGQDVRDDIESGKSLVNRDFENRRRRRIQTSVNCPHARGVPTPPFSKSAFSTVPTICICARIYSPRAEFAGAKRRERERPCLSELRVHT